jgi:hypothetical protein
MDYPVIISYSNFGYLDFAINMLISLNKTIKYHKVHFYCLDEEIYNTLKTIQFTNIDLTIELIIGKNISKSFENYGTIQYNAITHTKMHILKYALSKYNFVHFIDCDVVCMKEPTKEHYNKYANYDIVFQYDCGMYSPTQLSTPTLHTTWACTGNTTLRNSPETQMLLNKIIEYQNKYQNKNDQECLYQHFTDMGIKDITTYRPAKLFTYNVDEYTNGYWLNKDIGNLNNTYFFHANHVTGKNEKIRLLKKANQYFI